MKIIVSAYTEFNLGDDLFLHILFTRYPEHHFYLIAPKNYEKFTQNYLNVTTIYPKFFLLTKIISKSGITKGKVISDYIWNSFFKKISQWSDAFLLIGGSIFIQNKQLKVAENTAWLIRINQIFKNHFKFILGSNFGPYFSDEFLNIHKKYFASFTDVCFRDNYSKSLFSSLGNVRKHSDIVFHYNWNKHIPNKMPKTVGFSLVDLNKKTSFGAYQNKYLANLIQLIISYQSLNYSIYLFSFCTHEGDEDLITLLLSKFQEENRKKIIPIFYRGNNLLDFIDIFSKMEILYPVRFHAMVLGLVFEQEVFPITYSEKTINVLEDLNYNCDYIKVEDFCDLKNYELAGIMYPTRFKLSNRIKNDSVKHFSILDKLPKQDYLFKK